MQGGFNEILLVYISECMRISESAQDKINSIKLMAKQANIMFAGIPATAEHIEEVKSIIRTFA